MSVKSKIESLLFITTRPLAAKKIMEIIGAEKDETNKALEELFSDYNQPDKGINLQKIGSNYQFVTSGENSQLITDFLKEEVTGDLTQASLETLTVIAYRGPITRAELEMIRGVNCSIIIRNLLMRGLISEKEDKQLMVKKYQITFDFLKHLGLNEPSELPDYANLNSNEALEKLLNPPAPEQPENL